MEKKFNIVVGEDGTVKLPDAVLEKLEVKPGEEVRFEVDDNFYAVRLLSRIEAERLDYLNWMHLAVRSKTNIHFDVSFLTAKGVITTHQNPSFYRFVRTQCALLANHTACHELFFVQQRNGHCMFFPLIHRAGHCFAQTAFCPATGFIKIHIIIHGSAHWASYIFFFHNITSQRKHQTSTFAAEC